MKFLVFFLFTISVFPQEPYPDTLFLRDGRIFPCLITDINEKKVDITYGEKIDRSTVLHAIQRISLGKIGTIYQAEFILDLETIEGFIANRNEKVKEDKLAEEVKQKLDEFSAGNQMEIPEPDSINPDLLRQIPGYMTTLNRPSNKLSFGVLLIPYYSGRIYSINRYPSYPEYYEVYGTAINDINMEAQLAFAVEEKVRLTLDVTYTSTNFERRTETHQRSDGTYFNDSGTLTEEDITLLDFKIGIKYYLTDILSERVSVYLLAGIGKQFAIAEVKDETLFQVTDPYTRKEDNESEFTEDINSPFHFDIGFGAEYFFNHSLSLTSNIRFIYSSVSGNYEARQIQQYQVTTNSIDYKKSDFLTRIGLGLNFYL